jgi:hypothetical protein
VMDGFCASASFSTMIRNLWPSGLTSPRQSILSLSKFWKVAPGDKLLITANRREPALHVINGEIVMVSKLDDRGWIHLEDARILPASFKQFAYGCAVYSTPQSRQSCRCRGYLRRRYAKGALAMGDLPGTNDTARVRTTVTIIGSNVAFIRTNVGIDLPPEELFSGAHPTVRIEGVEGICGVSWYKTTLSEAY